MDRGIAGYISNVIVFSRLLTDREMCELEAYGPDGTWTNGEAACLADYQQPSNVEVRALQSFFFCGALGDGSAGGANDDEVFGGPELSVDFMEGSAAHVDRTYSSAACDAVDDTLVANADNDIDPDQSYVVRGMFCRVDASPATVDDVFTFVDDTVNTDITCTINPTTQSCATVPGVTARVAADSQVAISAANDTDDESAHNFHCLVYVTWE